MKIDSIINGIVLDHITAGKAMRVYEALGLENLDCSVAIIKNVKSVIVPNTGHLKGIPAAAAAGIVAGDAKKQLEVSELWLPICSLIQ